MNSILKLATLTLALACSVSAESQTEERGYPIQKLGNRQLDTAWTKAPTFFPTKSPTASPTFKPTPENIGGGPNICGTISTSDGTDLTLGPYSEPAHLRTKETFECNTEDGTWWHAGFTFPTYYYSFRVTKRCQYQISSPSTNRQWKDIRDVNSWIEQAAIVVGRLNNVAYKASDDDIIFSGWVTPDYETDVIISDMDECPEDYCVKIVGPSLTRKSLGSDYPTPSNPITDEDLQLLYAFSNADAHKDFYLFLRRMMRSTHKDRIFSTNHFMRCGCESFCMEDDKHWDEVSVEATCYVEELCGQKVFQIKYDDDYPEDQKAPWAATGTTRVMDWFNECASAMYGCTEITNFDERDYRGTRWGSSRYLLPKVYKYDSWEMSELPRMKNFGTNPADLFPLGECEGDCDNDNQCQDGLVCFQRHGDEPVPGCSGGTTGWDYCYNPIPPGNTLPVLGDEVGNNGSPPEAFPLGNCEGDCDRDSDCQDGLVCFQRNRVQPVPGCVGVGQWNTDYCVETDAPVPTQAPTSMLQFSNVYGLGGNRFNGFYDYPDNDEPRIAWTCPTADHMAELDHFGQYVAATQLMRDPGLDKSVPTVPCESEILQEPDWPDLPPPVGPSCDEIDSVYCYEMPEATCYATTVDGDCSDVEFTLVNKTSTYTYDNVAEWTDNCLAGHGCHRIPEYFDVYDGKLTNKGFPIPHPFYHSSGGWRLMLSNYRRSNGVDVVAGNNERIYYNCETWESSWGSANFTNGAGNRWDVWGNTYGDLFETKQCTSPPSEQPSLSPTTTMEPSSVPSLSPTLCAETYLTSEDLNIALVVDLSYSTYEKQFSSENPVGDLNNDGKANTILDAQVAAIQELLVSISKSASLRNSNCEINLISFSTDATDHGVWQPLNDSGDSYNSELLEYIKQELRAPTSSSDVFETNNGFTNFDAALDASVDYFTNTATANRKNLLVFLSDGEPNVRGDGDSEGYCSETTTFWDGDGTVLQCSDLGLEPGERHEFCRGNDPACSATKLYQDCVRGPTECMNADAVIQYDSEINALSELNVERMAIGVGVDSNVAWGSALWIIDNNPAKYLGVLPLQALNLDELSEYLSSLCILNTDPPTASPSAAPSVSPTTTFSPSSSPSATPSFSPSHAPSASPSSSPSASPTGTPTVPPTASPTTSPTVAPTVSPTGSPTTKSPTISPTEAPSFQPTASPSTEAPIDDDFEERGEDDDSDDIFFPPIGPDDCPDDVLLFEQTGVTPFPKDAVRIVSQDTSSVTVELVQTLTDSATSVDRVYYQYKNNPYSDKCYEEDEVYGEDTTQITIQCVHTSNVGVLELWIADDLDKGILSEGDDAVIPQCCHPTVPDKTPATKFLIVIKCKTECPDTIQ